MVLLPIINHLPGRFHVEIGFLQKLLSRVFKLENFEAFFFHEFEFTTLSMYTNIVI